MDIGCRFYTPALIADDIASHAGHTDIVVDLFAGFGNLHKAFLRNCLKTKALALDINPATINCEEQRENVSFRIVNCLDPDNIRLQLPPKCQKTMTFVLNPPFKMISAEQEISLWKKIGDFTPKFLTYRIECVAISAAIQAAPTGSILYAIIPDMILHSKRTITFFELLKRHFSLEITNTYKRARFSSAEVDVSVIRLHKNNISCISKYLDASTYLCSEKSIFTDKYKSIEDKICIFRGKVRPTSERELQISVKNLRVGGVKIKGTFYKRDIKDNKISNYSVAGDILLARVGPRMLGRVGIISTNYVITNESIFTLRITDSSLRKKVYSELISNSFIDWCLSKSRGTANYFITKDSVKEFILNIFSKMQMSP